MAVWCTMCDVLWFQWCAGVQSDCVSTETHINTYTFITKSLYSANILFIYTLITIRNADLRLKVAQISKEHKLFCQWNTFLTEHCVLSRTHCILNAINCSSRFLLLHEEWMKTLLLKFYEKINPIIPFTRKKDQSESSKKKKTHKLNQLFRSLAHENRMCLSNCGDLLKIC